MLTPTNKSLLTIFLVWLTLALLCVGFTIVIVQHFHFMTRSVSMAGVAMGLFALGLVVFYILSRASSRTIYSYYAKPHNYYIKKVGSIGLSLLAIISLGQHSFVFPAA
jgi:hypothetical protein